MARSRLSAALRGGALSLPGGGPVLVLNPPADFDPGGLDPARLTLEQGFFPDHQALARRGFRVTRAATGRFGAALVCLPRTRERARALVARAAGLVGDGPVLVDGQKTDGIGAMIRALRGRVGIGGSLSAGHGKLIWFAGGDFADWQASPRRIGEGFVTRPGVFSADGPDPGSRALAAALTGAADGPRGHGADLGAGWGYLARAALGLPGVVRLDLVEADHAALICARENLSDPRVRFHWADARDWQGEGMLDFVITNPPFHEGRGATPELGRAFIRAAARLLAPRGQLWLVANRHLPYEATLGEHFRQLHEIPGPPGFKLIRAAGPRRADGKMR